MFCETDGARLADAAAASESCRGCGGSGTNDGDGYCSSCGHRLGQAAQAAPADQADQADDAALEAAALLKLHGDGRFGAPAGRSVAESLSSADAPSCVAVVRGVLEMAEALERAGLSWSPRADDFTMTDGHALRLTRLRGARALAASERLDVQHALDALGVTLLPAAAIQAPPPLVRALVTAPPPHRRARSVDEARALLTEIEDAAESPGAAASFVAAATDVGVRHAHNEDAFALASGETKGEPWVVLVVCDGVSSSTNAVQASSIASKSACDALAHFARSGEITHEASVHSVSEAIRSAHVAVCASMTEAVVGDPPGSTIVCALVYRNRLTVGWVGDSRAYWITKRGGELLTHDHSWVNETVDRGEMKEEEALRSSLAHALTKCIGPLEDPKAQVEPSVRTRDLAGPGHLVLLSDGVWNYFSRDELVALVRTAPAPATPSRIARWLVNRALASGGHDNTSAAIYQHR